MTSHGEVPRVVSASREIAAGPQEIFELIADPTQQSRWDGNDNLAEAPAGHRIRRTGDVFLMTTTKGNVRENHVVEFDESQRVAWRPAEPGRPPPGHLWRWELEPVDASRTRVTHTYDWTQLTDQKRFPRARATTADRLRASLDRLAAIVLRLLMRGSTNAGIGKRLCMSPKTASVHVTSIMRKLGATNRSQAAWIARQAGIDDATGP